MTKYKWTSLAPYGLSFEKENNTMKRSPLTFDIDTLKEIFRDYCIQSSGEIPNEVDNIYVIIGGEEVGIPSNFSSLPVEFRDDDEDEEDDAA